MTVNGNVVWVRSVGDTVNIVPSTGGGIPYPTGQSGKVLSNNGTSFQWVVNSAAVAWGGITGTLANQTDLNTALGLKAPLSSPTFTGTPVFPNGLVLTTPSFTTGFTIGGAAASGKIPIGNGTNYVASTPNYPNAAGAANNIVKSDGTNFTSAANLGQWENELKVAGSDVTTTGQTLVDITGLVSPTLTASSRYEIEGMLIVSTSAVATGVTYGINCTGTSTIQGVLYIGPTTVNTGVQVLAENGTNINNTIATPSMLTTATETGVVWIHGYVDTGTGSPVISIRHAKTTSGTSTVKIGSYLHYRKL